MTSLEPLLVVQGHDTTIDQLNHRLAAVPARAAIAAKQAELAQLAAAVEPVRQRREELSRSQKRVEDEVVSLEAKIGEEDARLYSGQVTAARDLQDLQQELEALRRRQSDLETEILEIMDLTEPVDASLVDLDRRQSEVRADIERLEVELADAEAEIGGLLDEARAARAQAAEGLDDALVATYERLRTQLGGTAVARLSGTTCGACHLSLPAVEIDRLRRDTDDGVPTCTECGALLVL